MNYVMIFLVFVLGFCFGSIGGVAVKIVIRHFLGGLEFESKLRQALRLGLTYILIGAYTSFFSAVFSQQENSTNALVNLWLIGTLTGFILFSGGENRPPSRKRKRKKEWSHWWYRQLSPAFAGR